MDESLPNYRRAFLKSPQHAVLGLLTLGLGFLSASLLGLVAGVTAYALGWIYLPDMPFFRRAVDRRHEEVRAAAARAQLAEFLKRRDELLNALSSSRRARYDTLAAVCRSIEAASADSSLTPADAAADPRLRKLDELMWTYLRLLTIGESLERFLEAERREDLPSVVHQAELEAARLAKEVESLKQSGAAPADARQRLLGSRLERLDVLRKRLQRVEQAQQSLDLVISEQERLDQQIKLIRADAVATKNAEALTARIDATVEHLDQTNRWLAELDEFKDVVGELPATDLRVGFESAAPPAVAAAAVPVREKAKVKAR
jgi:hypothetical protein